MQNVPGNRDRLTRFSGNPLPDVKALFKALDSTKARTVLLGLHMVMLVAVFFLEHSPAPDQATYLALADGLSHGVYSVYNGILDPAPIDVMRTHGYPIFLLVLRSISKNLDLVFAAQALFHIGTLLLVLRLLRNGGHSRFRQNMFLLLMLPQFQLIHYVYQVFPETLMAFLCALLVLLFSLGFRGPARTVVIGIVAAVAFWVRPIMLLFPLFVLIGDLLLAQKGERLRLMGRNAGILVVFAGLGPLMYGLWNFRSHGVFKPLPLSGSAVITNMGIWQMRLPGHGTLHYFQYSFFGREFLPFVSDEEAAAHYLRYQEQWARIDSVSMLAMTDQDKLYLPKMAEYKNEFYVTRSPQYTMALEDAMAKENKKMMLDEPGYFLLSRAYTAIRLWITNINYPMIKIVFKPEPGVVPIVGRPQGVKGWLGALVPFAITAISFGIGLSWSAVQVLRNRRRWYERRYLLYMILYGWLIYIPMSIQSRFTVPVHALAIACIALALTDRWPLARGAESGSRG